MSTWLVRPNLDGNRTSEFLQNNIIAIGWPDAGNLAGKSSEDIKTALKESYQYSGTELGNRLSSVDSFVNQMEPGDLVLVPNGDDIHIAEITGDYNYVQNPGQETFPNQRTVRWLNKVTRSDLSNDLRSSLKDRRTVGNLNQHTMEIESLGKGERFIPDNMPIDVSYPLRPDWTISFQIPADMTQVEASRLAMYLQTLYFEPTH